MPTVYSPYSDSERAAFFDKLEKQALKDQEAGNVYLDPVTLELIRQFMETYGGDLINLASMLALKGRELREKNVAIKDFEVAVRDFCAVLKRMILRRKLPVDVFRYYKMELRGTTPKIKSQKHLLRVAQELIQGDAKAVQNGFEPMVNPGAEEVAQFLEAAEKELSEAQDAASEYDELQKKVAAMRPEANRLISDAVGELRFFLRRKNPVSRRRIMRNYGVEFKYMVGEPRDPEDEPDTTPEEAPKAE